MELSNSNIKKILYVFKRKLFVYFHKWNPALFGPRSKNKENQPRENFLYSRKMELANSF